MIFLSGERSNPFHAYDVIAEEVFKRFSDSDVLELFPIDCGKRALNVSTLLEQGIISLVLKLLAEIAMFSSQLLESSRDLKLTRLLSSMQTQRPSLMKRARDCFMLEFPVQSTILILSL